MAGVDGPAQADAARTNHAPAGRCGYFPPKILKT